VFGDRVFFSGVAFGVAARFLDSVFYGSVHFDGHSVEQWRRYLKVITYGVNAEVVDELKERPKIHGAPMDPALIIS